MTTSQNVTSLLSGLHQQRRSLRQWRSTASRAVDPALLVPGFMPTAANTLPPNFIAAFVSGSGDLPTGSARPARAIRVAVTMIAARNGARGLGFAYDLSGDGKTIVRGGAASPMTACRATSRSIKSPIRRRCCNRNCSSAASRT